MSRQESNADLAEAIRALREELETQRAKAHHIRFDDVEDGVWAHQHEAGGEARALKAVIAKLDALLASASAVQPMTWECGCGSVNGVNLAACSVCHRDRSETRFEPASAVPHEQIIEIDEDGKVTAGHELAAHLRASALPQEAEQTPACGCRYTIPHLIPCKKHACDNYTPPTFNGHWREWHRGHGCHLDPDSDAPPRTPPSEGDPR